MNIADVIAKIQQSMKNGRDVWLTETTAQLLCDKGKVHLTLNGAVVITFPGNEVEVSNSGCIRQKRDKEWKNLSHWKVIRCNEQTWKEGQDGYEII